MTVLRRIGGTTFRSLRVRNYRLFFFGQLVSVSGTWMQQIAQDWLVLRLSNSGLAVGVTTGLQFLPMLLFGMWGGLLADRLDKRRVLVVTQATAGVLALILGLLVATGVVALWMVFLIAFLLGCVTAIDNPTRQAFVTEMVGRAEVTNAVGLNSATFNAARIVGPAVAAVLIKFVGLSPAFFLNSLSYLAVIAGLLAMDPGALFRQPRAPRQPGQLRAALRYVWVVPELRSTILLVAVVATFGMNLGVVLPLLARFTFHGGAGTYGLFTSVMALGALAGALAAAARKVPTSRLQVGTAMAFGALSVVTAFAPTVWLVVVALIPTGAAAISFMATSNSLLQLGADPSVRGRVMALYVLVFLGSTPLGGPLIGWICEQWNPGVGLGVAGIVTLLASSAAWVFLRRSKPETGELDRQLSPLVSSQ